MAINKISGNILQDNLVRGANLAVQGNLVYFDIVNTRVGINTSVPTTDFDVNGNIAAGNLNISSQITVTGNITTAGQVSANGNISGNGVTLSANAISAASG